LARISVPVDDELMIRAQRIFPWGTLAPTMRKVFEHLIVQIERDGISIIEEVLSPNYNPMPRKKGKVR
jgi:hypothetical protein